MKRVGILGFDDMEELDAVGPYEVFGVAHHQRPEAIEVCLVAVTVDRPLRCVHGLRLLADYDFASAPRIDILLIPGGIGSRVAARDEALLEWLKCRAQSAEIVASVCTGARITLAADIARGRRITTHHSAIAELRADGRAAEVLEGVRFVQDGSVVHSAGVSAGIDMALWLVSQVCDVDLARDVARSMEYVPAAINESRQITPMRSELGTG